MGTPAALSSNRLPVAKRQKNENKKNSKQRTTGLWAEAHNLKGYISPEAHE